MLFVLEAAGPQLGQIPQQELVGVTVLLLTCYYSGREFIRIGFYLHIVYNDDKYIEYRKSVEPVPEEELGDEDDAEEEDPDAMDADEMDDDDGDMGDDDMDDGMQMDQQPAAPAAPAHQQQHAQQAVGSKPEPVKSPQEFAGRDFDPKKLSRNISEAPRLRTLEIDWNHPWNATLKHVYRVGTQQGKPTEIVRLEWLTFLETKVLKREQPLLHVDQEWALLSWTEMLKHDPGGVAPNRSFDWLDDVDLPKEIDVLRILEQRKILTQKGSVAPVSASPFRK